MFNIGNRISLLREANNLSANKLSKELQVDPSTINKIEKGTAKPSLELLFKICSYFDMSLSEFFDTSEASLSSELLAWLDIGKNLTDEERATVIQMIKSLKAY
ncbi:hypothetical protein CH76_01825 [Lysinibacillus sp. BF-4]|uniref:helix-turn-helix domain-containing protein n=1 Tax=Lysinibacillus sp. BF-4 TaxID=1473546 RepID=UPI0005030DA9|nr:helix-turn-helix transcriptional regulator [Lysinibacillus sp. BF-4]KFL44570.1 hypothetical protein CH76_01825 [Lysinibacillus sp. BF-4]